MKEWQKVEDQPSRVQLLRRQDGRAITCEDEHLGWKPPFALRIVIILLQFLVFNSEILWAAVFSGLISDIEQKIDFVRLLTKLNASVRSTRGKGDRECDVDTRSYEETS